MAAYECFDVTIEGGIAHIRFSRPDAFNSFTPAFWRELPAAVADISDNAKARVIVLSAEGKHFTAGMDIAVFMEGGLDLESDNPQVEMEAFRLNLLRGLQKTMSCLEDARMPVLAAIQGGAVGAGVDLATACDCRYASKDAFFCIQETNIGMTADVGTFPRLAKIIPEGWARQISYTGERLPAEKAQAIGLVNEVYETPEALLDGVMGIAAEIASKSPLAVSGCKRMINYARDHSTADGLDYIATWQTGMFRPADIKESYMAKTEKRAPVYAELKPLKQGL